MKFQNNTRITIRSYTNKSFEILALSTGSPPSPTLFISGFTLTPTPETLAFYGFWAMVLPTFEGLGIAWKGSPLPTLNPKPYALNPKP